MAAAQNFRTIMMFITAVEICARLKETQTYFYLIYNNFRQP